MLKPDVINELQDLRFLTWSRSRKSSGTAGSYLKAYSTVNGRKLYYKLSCFDPTSGITGHECVNELIADRLLTILGVDHLKYQLVHALVTIDDTDQETYVCVSEDFKEPGESKIALDDYYELEHEPGESVIDFCIRMGWEDYIYSMLAFDYLILNRDRHGANIEILRNSSTGQTRPSPLFDHGVSLIFSCRNDEEAAAFDLAKDIPVQSFVGTRSAADNLKLIPEDRKPAFRRLEDRDRTVIFNGLDNVLSPMFQDKIWDMIWSRWCYYESM